MAMFARPLTRHESCLNVCYSMYFFLFWRFPDRTQYPLKDDNFVHATRCYSKTEVTELDFGPLLIMKFDSVAWPSRPCPAPGSFFIIVLLWFYEFMYCMWFVPTDSQNVEATSHCIQSVLSYFGMLAISLVLVDSRDQYIPQTCWLSIWFVARKTYSHNVSCFIICFSMDKWLGEGSDFFLDARCHGADSRCSTLLRQFQIGSPRVWNASCDWSTNTCAHLDRIIYLVRSLMVAMVAEGRRD